MPRWHRKSGHDRFQHRHVMVRKYRYQFFVLFLWSRKAWLQEGRKELETFCRNRKNSNLKTSSLQKNQCLQTKNMKIIGVYDTVCSWRQVFYDMTLYRWPSRSRSLNCHARLDSEDEGTTFLRKFGKLLAARHSAIPHNTSSIRHHLYENLHLAPCSHDGSYEHFKETAKFTCIRNTLNTDINLHAYTKIQFVPHRKQYASLVTLIATRM